MRKMSGYIYETIRNDQLSMVNAFVTQIQSSALHWHREYELLGLLEGSVTVRVGKELVTLHRGELLLINSNVVHAIASMEGTENLCMVVQLRPELFAAEKDSSAELYFYLDSTAQEPPAPGYEHFFYRMAKIVYETMSDEKNAAFRARAQTCFLISELMDYAVYDVRYRDAAAESTQELLAGVIRFLEQNLAEEDVAERACRAFGLSRKTLDRDLKNALGLSTKGILDNLRMEKAKDLLKNSSKNMSYILDVCGFGSEKSFYRSFRQKTGLTPKEFRERGILQAQAGGLRDYLDLETPKVKALLSAVIREAEKRRDEEL